MILEAMERFEESEECYDKSLELSQQSLVCDNKARMLRAWQVIYLKIQKNYQMD